MSQFRKIVEDILKENNIVLDEEQVIYRTYADKPYLNNIEYSFMNKPANGLWGCRDNSWKEWCEENDFGYNPNYFEWILKPNSKLYTVNNTNNFIYLLKNYQLEESDGNIFIDYLKLAKDYDAIELTKNGNIQLHYGIETDDPELQKSKYKRALRIGMNSWDVPSICVFNPSKTVEIINYGKDILTKYKDYKTCLDIIKDNPTALNAIPNDFIDYNMCLEAIKQYGGAIKYVPEKFKDYNMYLEAAKTAPYILLSIPKKFKEKIMQELGIK